MLRIVRPTPRAGAFLLGWVMLGTGSIRSQTVVEQHLQFRGHAGGVAAVAFSPDGKTLASGGHDRTLILWDLATGTVKRAIRGSKAEILALAYAPGGQAIATVGDAAAPARRVLATPEEVPGLVVAGVATGDPAGTLRFWDLTRGTEVGPAASSSGETGIGAADRFLALAFTRDGKNLATGGQQGSLVLWDPAAHRIRLLLGGHSGPVAGVAFSPDGQTLASAGWDGTVRTWDPATGQLRATLGGHSRWVTAVAFSPDGQTLASAGWDRTVRLWDPATGQLRSTLFGHDAAVHALAFSPDGQTLASGGLDQDVRLWDLAAGRSRITLRGQTDAINALAFAPDGATVAAGGQDRVVRLWDVAEALGLRRARLPIGARIGASVPR